MTTRERDTPEPAKQPRDPDFVGADAAMHRAAKIARRRAMETSGAVAVFRDGKIVRVSADGTGRMHTG